MKESNSTLIDCAVIGAGLDHMEGVVTTLTDKGFGFISVKDDPKNLFFHSNELLDLMFNELKVGDVMSFDVLVTQKGPAAVNVVRGRSLWPSEGRQRFVDQDMIALKIVDERIRVLGLTRDGTCQFVDPNLNIHSLLYVSSESAELRHAIEEYEYLLNWTSVSEAMLQDFFERHPEFLLGGEHRTAHPHVVLEGDLHKGRLIPDFVLESLKPGALSDILEVKLPSARLYVRTKNRARFSAAVSEASAQLREYSAFFDREENREKIEMRYGLKLYSPNLFLVIGRTTDICPILERRIQRDTSLPLHLWTYDDVMLRMRERVRRQEWRSLGPVV